MQTLIQLLIGAVAGVLVKFGLPAKVQGDFTGSILTGIMGSFIAGVLARNLDSTPQAIASAVGGLVMAGAFQFAVRRGQKRQSPVTRDQIPAA